MTTETNSQNAPSPEPGTIEDALAQFEVQLQADGRSPHTVRQYQRHVRKLARWAADVGHGGNVKDFDNQTLARFMIAPCARLRPDGQDKKAASVNALRTSLRCFFSYLHDVGLIAINPTRRLRRAYTSPPPDHAHCFVLACEFQHSGVQRVPSHRKHRGGPDSNLKFQAVVNRSSAYSVT